MNREEFFTDVFTRLGLPVVIGSWDDDEVPVFPYVEYHRENADDLHADGAVYAKADDWLVSIYAKKKDIAGFWDLTEKLEEILDGKLCDYQRSGDIFTGDVVFCEYDLTLMR